MSGTPRTCPSSDIELGFAKDDTRPVVVLDDVAGAEFDSLRPGAPAGRPRSSCARSTISRSPTRRAWPMGGLPAPSRRRAEPAIPVRLDYGTTGLELDLAGVNATVLRPRHPRGCRTRPRAFGGGAIAARRPAAAGTVAARETVAVVIPDGTRPAAERPAAALAVRGTRPCARDRTSRIVVGTGSHRANTGEELDRMLGPRIARNYRVVNHNAHDPAALARGRPVAVRLRRRLQPRDGRRRPSNRPGLHRAAPHGGILGRLQGGVPRRPRH